MSKSLEVEDKHIEKRASLNEAHGVIVSVGDGTTANREGAQAKTVHNVSFNVYHAPHYPAALTSPRQSFSRPSRRRRSKHGARSRYTSTVSEASCICRGCIARACH